MKNIKNKKIHILIGKQKNAELQKSHLKYSTVQYNKLHLQMRPFPSSPLTNLFTGQGPYDWGSGSGELRSTSIRPVTVFPVYRGKGAQQINK
jgi:hypothetical protein